MMLSLKTMFQKYQNPCFGVREFVETEFNNERFTIFMMAANMAAKTEFIDISGDYDAIIKNKNKISKKINTFRCYRQFLQFFRPPDHMVWYFIFNDNIIISGDINKIRFGIHISRHFGNGNYLVFEYSFYKFFYPQNIGVECAVDTLFSLIASL